jgi:hypothetical protein
MPGAQDEQRFLESGIEAGEIRHVGEVLSVTIDNQYVKAGRGSSPACLGDAIRVRLTGDGRLHAGHAELRKCDFSKLDATISHSKQSLY